MQDLTVSIREKTFQKNGAGTSVLKDVEFTVAAGSIVCLYGPSGCGKTTMLRIIAGLEDEFRGEVHLGERPVTRPTKDIGLTVQTHVSYDWLTVADNITFGLRYAPRARRSVLGGWLGLVDRAAA